MFDIPLNVANTLFTASNVLVVVGALFSVVGGFGVFYAGGIRERYADERINANEASTARALADAARANERTAALDKEAAALKLELAKRTNPLVARAISANQAVSLKSSLLEKNLSIGFMFPTTDSEVATYAKALESALAAAGVTFGMKGGPHSQISSGGHSLLGNGLTLISRSDAASRVLEDALQKAGIPFVLTTEGLPGVSFGMPILVVGSRRPLQK